MPTSDVNLIPAVLVAVASQQPTSVLDVGIGFGKYGALFREYLDYAAMVEHKRKLRLVGVEGFEQYRNLNWQHYDEVRVENFVEHKDEYKGFDVLLAVDSLEHVPYEQGRDFIEQMRTQNKHVLISTPAPFFYLEQDAVHGNELEVHRHMWTHEEFTQLGGQRLYSGVCQLYLFKGD